MDQGKAVLIAGCGDVGIALGQRLARAGLAAYGLRRNVEQLPREIIPLAVDLSRPFRLTNLPARLHAVVFLPSSRRDASLYRGVRVAGFDRLHEALQAANCAVRRWIYVSSTSVYGQNSGEHVDEHSPADPVTETARILLQGENRLKSLSLPGLTLRFSGIYGPGRTMMLRKVAQGSACVPGLWTNRIHRDDCAAMLHHLLDLQSVDEVYIGVDNLPVLQCDVMSWLAEQLDLPLTVSNAKDVYTGKRLGNDRIRQTGFEFQYPDFMRGYQSMISDFRSKSA